MWQEIGMFLDKPFWATVCEDKDGNWHVVGTHVTRKDARKHRDRVSNRTFKVMRLEVVEASSLLVIG